MKNKNILLTGASGFLAAGLIHKFTKSKLNINLVLGTRAPSKLKNEKFFSDYKITYLDMEDEQSFDLALQNIDLIIHLAATNHTFSQNFPEKAKLINVLNFDKFLKLAKENGVRGIIYLSTIHVYSGGIAILNEESKLGPSSIYAKTHLEAEELVEKYSSKSFNGIVLRLSNCFGNPLHNLSNCWSLLAFDLVKNAVINKKLILKSSGQQYRDFIPLSTVSNVLYELIEKFDMFKNYFEIYNLSNQNSLKVLDFTKLIQDSIQKINGELIPIQLGLDSKEESFCITIQNEKIKKILGENYFSKDLFENELHSLINFCNNNFKANIEK